MGVLQWLPNFFIRSHQLSIQQIGLYFGPVLATGMTVGLLLGGVIGNRLAARSVTLLIWLCAATMVALVPLYLLIFWLPSLVAALAATFVGTTASVIYAPSVTAAWQTLCDPQARGTAAGVSSFAKSLIGSAGCSYFVGTVSDWLAPQLGAESLRYALTAGMGFCFVAAALFVFSARLAREERAEHVYAS
jgi:sugar phosphate permease